ncbi:MAG: hypothetical protein BZ133_08515 [Methanosphaera sp. SHI613]|jgi:hypothetical protein|nr:MAG: hypothetical protein BZ133_08515 [Methanosphaera sp. SHI613]
MINNELKVIFEEFNYRANNLINSFTRNNMDEQSLIFLSKRTKHLLSFTHRILLKMLFKSFDGLSFLKDKINEDFIDIDKMVEIIIEQINLNLDDMINQNVDEKRKEDIDVIVDYLTILKNIINKLSSLFISGLKFQADVIDEDTFRKEYRKFKYDIQEDKLDLENKLNITLV